MDRHPTLDNVAIAFNRHYDDEGYFSGSEATITPPPATPTNSPVVLPAEALEEPTEIPLDELLGDDLPEGQPAAPLNEQPGQLRAGPAHSWPDTRTMATLFAVLFLLPMTVSPRPPEAFNLVAIHLVWVAYAAYGLLSPRWPRAAVWISGILALESLAMTREGAQRAEWTRGEEHFPQSRTIALLVSAGTLLLLLDRAAVAVVRGWEELRRGRGGAGGREG